jgi:hypothetical protein
VAIFNAPAQLFLVRCQSLPLRQQTHVPLNRGTDPGRFVLTRTGSTAAPLTVKVTLTGGATNGVDYRRLPVAIIILAGRAALAVAIVPLDDVVVEGTEVVSMRIAASDAYRTGSPATAAVSIFDND